MSARPDMSDFLIHFTSGHSFEVLSTAFARLSLSVDCWAVPDDSRWVSVRVLQRGTPAPPQRARQPRLLLPVQPVRSHVQEGVDHAPHRRRHRLADRDRCGAGRRDRRRPSCPERRRDAARPAARRPHLASSSRCIISCQACLVSALEALAVHELGLDRRHGQFQFGVRANSDSPAANSSWPSSSPNTIQAIGFVRTDGACGAAGRAGRNTTRGIGPVSNKGSHASN